MVLWCTVGPVKWIEYSKEIARNWDEEGRKGTLEKEKREDWQNRKRSLNEYMEKRPGIRTDTPHHTTVETLTSELSLSPPAITLSFLPSALPLHLASSLSLTPFPLFHSFYPPSPISSLFPLCLHHFALLLFLSVFFCNWIVLSLLCVFLNQSLFSIWCCLSLYRWFFWQPHLHPFFPSDLLFHTIKGDL